MPGQAAYGGRSIAVIGLGNVLMGDDAAGPAVVASLLARYSFPPGVLVVDAGTPGLDLTPFTLDRDALVVVDTVHADGPPGSIHLLRRDALLAVPHRARLSPHEPALQEVLLLAELRNGFAQEVLLVGIVPGRVKTGVGLSLPVREALPEAEHLVLAELERLGSRATALPSPAEPDLWWERQSTG